MFIAQDPTKSTTSTTDTTSNSTDTTINSTGDDASTGDNDNIHHPFFENFLRGWEAAAHRTEEFCAVHPKGNGMWGGNSAFESHQRVLTCPKIADGIDPGLVDMRFEYSELPVLGNSPPNTPLLPLTPINFTNGQGTDVPHIYDDLTTSGSGIFAYRGGLTTPPCTEIVHWNLLDTPL